MRLPALLCLLGLLLVGAATTQGAGVTIISHGFQPNGASGWPIGWVDATANQIVAQASTRGMSGSVWQYDPATQTFVLQSPTGTAQTQKNALTQMVLKFNWTAESNDAGGGFAEAAGEALFSALMKGGQLSDGTRVAFVEVPLHFIGHSRGAVVNSEAIERLGALGINVDHMTTLDPHPAGGLYYDTIAGVNVWENVVFTDNYWRADGNPADFDGMSVLNAFSRRLNESILDISGYSFEHSDVHLWYYGTTDTNTTASNGEQTVPTTWYSGDMGPRTGIGYNFSRLFAGSRTANGGSIGLKGTGIRAAIQSQKWLANGDFTYELGDQVIDKSAYTGHGGSSLFNWVTSGSEKYARLSFDAQRLRHNTIFVPQMQGVASLGFRARCIHRFGDDVKLRIVAFGGTIATLPFTSASEWADYSVDIGGYQGQSGTIEFNLDDSVLGGSQLELDDLRVVGDPKPWANVQLLPLMKYSYSQGESLTTRWDTANNLTTAGVMVEFIWDTDQNPYNGSNSVAGVAASSSGSTVLTVPSLPPGTYFLYARIAGPNTPGGRYDFDSGRITVVAAPPQPGLSVGTVSPPAGTTADTYTYTVNYYDPSGSGPLESKVYVNGSPFDMTLQSGTGTAANGTYRLQKSNPLGVHNYFFSFKSAGGTVVNFPSGLGLLTGPTVSSTGGGAGPATNLVSVTWRGESGGQYFDTTGGEVFPVIGPEVRRALGDQLWFTGTPAPGWQIDRWEQKWASPEWIPVSTVSGNSALMIVSGNGHTIRCTFQRINSNERILNLSAIGPGLMSPVAGAYAYSETSQASVTATPLPGADFSGWTLDGTNAGQNRTITFSMGTPVERDLSLRAAFVWTNSVQITTNLPSIQDVSVRTTDVPGTWSDYRYSTEVRVQSVTTTVSAEAFFKFDIARLPSNAQIVGASLHAYAWAVPTGNPVVEVQKNTSDWSEEQQMNTLPSRTSTSWPDVFQAGQSWHVFDLVGVEPLWKDWIQLGWMKGQNYGLRIRPSREKMESGLLMSSSIKYYTRENGSLNPYLRVTYLGRQPVPTIATDRIGIVVPSIAKGQNAPNETLLIRNVGEGTLNFTVSNNVPWLTLSGVTSGTSTNEDRQLNLTFNTAGLPVGTTNTTITITDTNASNSPYTVPVTVTVLGPSIGAAPAVFDVVTAEGSTPNDTTLEIRNAGVGTLDFTILKSAPWLTVTPTSGSSTGEVRQIKLQFTNTSSLAPGLYQDTIVITNSTGDAPPVSVPVTLTVRSRVATPTFSPPGNTTFDGSGSITLSCTTIGAIIRYTLDGSAPSEFSPQFTGSPIIITSTVVVRAKAFKAGSLPSDEGIASYTVISPVPRITIQPLSQNVSAGQNASFIVVATGTAPLSYQWRKGGLPILGETNSGLTVSNADWRAAGAYTVLITNAAGMALSRPAHLQVGNQTVVSWGAYTNVFAGVTGVVAVAAGNGHSLALRSDGTVVASGANYAGQTNIPAAAQSGVVAVSAGQSHSLALRSDGSVVAWGQLGTNVPAEAQSEVVAVAAGDYHSLALKGNGTVIAWGGDYAHTNVPSAAQNGVVAVEAGSVYSLALKRDGTVAAWGYNSYGTTNVPATAQGGVVAVAGGYTNGLALKSDGTVVEWASNPTVPAGLSGVVAVAADFHYLALKADGSVVAWGGGWAGQTNVPTGLNGVVAVAAGGAHSLAVRSDAVPSAPFITVQPQSQTVNIGGGVTFSVATAANGTLTDDFELGTFRAGVGWATNNDPGIAVWQVQAASGLATNTSLGGLYHVRSGAITHGQTTVLRLVVNCRAGAASFDYRVSSEEFGPAAGDFFEFYLNGIRQVRTNGETGWRTHAFTVAVGTNTLEWRYLKDASSIGALDAVFVDNISVPLAQPLNFSSAEAYQWRKDDVSILGATNSTLSLSNVQPSVGFFGGYSGALTVVVSNGSGSVTSAPPAELWVGSPPVITTQPLSQTVVAGSTLTNSIVVSGTWFLSAQWLKNGTNIPAYLNFTNGFILPNIQLGDAGNYQAIFTNRWGAAASAVAAITVTVPNLPQQPHSPFPDDYATNVSQLVTLTWAATNATSYDVIFGVEPTLQFFPEVASTTNSSLPKALGTGQTRYWQVVARNANGSSAGPIWRFTTTSTPPSATITFRTANDELSNPVIDVDGASRVSSGFLGQLYVGTSSDPNTFVPIGTPQPFLAGASAGFINAGLVSPSVVGFAPGTSGYYQLRVWESASGSTYELARTVGPVGRQGVSAVTPITFGGGVLTPPSANRHPAFSVRYDFLSLAIVSHPIGQTVAVGSDATFVVIAGGPGTLIFQWLKDGVSLPGATNATLLITNCQAGHAGTYSALVTSSVPEAGSRVSSSAVLTVSTPLLYRTTFEGNEGYLTSFTLSGQNNWTHFGTGGNGLVDNFIPGAGRSAYIGFAPPTGVDDFLNVWRPLNLAPVPTSLSIVTFSVTMLLIDSSNGRRDDFLWSIYNTNGARLFSLDFDNSTEGINYGLDNGAGFVATGYQFTRGAVHELTITLNFPRNRWQASLSGTALTAPLPITTTNAALNLGGINAVWAIRTPGSAGDNYLVFDNYQIAGEPRVTVPKLLSATRQVDGQLRLQVQAEPATHNAIEVSTNLAQWTTLMTNSTPNGVIDVLDGAPLTFPRRFYRVRLVEP